MAERSEQEFLATLARQTLNIINAPIRELRAQLGGYELALVAIIAALDKSGALPIAAAQQALDAAAADVAATPETLPTRTVLRDLSAHLDRLTTPPDRRH